MTFDNIALVLCIAAIVARLLDRPWWSNLAATLAIAASTVAGWCVHRRQCEQARSARLAEARRAGRVP